jgi:hypothetical protein
VSCELSADKLRFDPQWLEADLDARDGYRAALGGLLRTMQRHDPLLAKTHFTVARQGWSPFVTFVADA